MEPAAESVGPRDASETSTSTERLELANVENSLDNLMTFPCVRILAERGKIQLHGAYFERRDGRRCDPRSGDRGNSSRSP